MLTIRKLQSAASQPQLLQIGRPLIGLLLCAGLGISLGHNVIGPILLINPRISLTRLALRECDHARCRAIFALVQQPLCLMQSVMLRGRSTFKYRGIMSNEALLKDSVIGEPSIALLCRWPAKIYVYCCVILCSIQPYFSRSCIYTGRILV